MYVFKYYKHRQQILYIHYFPPYNNGMFKHYQGSDCGKMIGAEFLMIASVWRKYPKLQTWIRRKMKERDQELPIGRVTC